MVDSPASSGGCTGLPCCFAVRIVSEVVEKRWIEKLEKDGRKINHDGG